MLHRRCRRLASKRHPLVAAVSVAHGLLGLASTAEFSGSHGLGLREVSLDLSSPQPRPLELRFVGASEVLALCDIPEEHAAGCKHLDVVRMQDLGSCAQLVSMTQGADTMNVKGDLCEIQSCYPQSSDLQLVGHASKASGSSGLVTLLSHSWAAWPGLSRRIALEADTVVLIPFLALMDASSAFLAARLSIDGAEQRPSRCATSGTTGLKIAGFFVGRMPPGDHVITVEYRTTGVSADFEPNSRRWHMQTLDVVPLPWAKLFCATPGSLDREILVGRHWVELPGLTTNTFISIPSSALITFQVAASGPVTNLVISLFVDEVEQTETTCSVRSSNVVSCAAMQTVTLDRGHHYFTVKLRGAGGVLSTSGEDWQTTALTVAVLPGSEVHRAVPHADSGGSAALKSIEVPARAVVLAIARTKHLGLTDASTSTLAIDGVQIHRGPLVSDTTLASITTEVFVSRLVAGPHDFTMEHFAAAGSGRAALEVVLLYASVPYTDLFGGMAVYSYLCADAKLKTFTPMSQQAGLIGKDEDYWTTSILMKHDIRSFFQDIAQNWTVVELGSYRGYTTNVLADVFELVIAVDASPVFLGYNRENNADHTNVLYMNLHSRMDGLKALRHNRVEVVFVDAEHDYESVFRDIQDLLDIFSDSLRYLIFDDYGTDDGVRQAVDHFVKTGILSIDGGLGHGPPWKYHDKVVEHWEGVVCSVLSGSVSSATDDGEGDFDDGRVLGRVFNWFAENLWRVEDVVQLMSGGAAVTSRGPGRWRKDKNYARGVWLDWPSHKPFALGGPRGNATMEMWFLQFDRHYDKFAAGQLGASHSAAGVAKDLLEAMFRRVFVSVTHEWCNSANECGHS